MKLPLKRFQTEYVAELHDRFDTARQIADANQPVAVLLNAPTGAGKTVMATTLIEELLEGGGSSESDLAYSFLWLTDQPELNKQTFDKMVENSELSEETFVIINGGFDMETFQSGHVYFLNTQKLGAGATSFIKTGDDRDYTLWDTVRNTVAVDPKKFVLFIDEAHRGTKGTEAEEAESIVQKFLIGGTSKEVPAIPLVVGISATPDRFVNACGQMNRPLFRVDVEAEKVRDSGLLKEYVDIEHVNDDQPGDVSMLIRATRDLISYSTDWATYGNVQHVDVRRPVMVVQVEDASRSSSAHSATDLEEVVRVISRELGAEACGGWLAHAFQEGVDFLVEGQLVRYIAPSDIDKDEEVKVVLFKSSLNTGWDCPRAEVMVSFRKARDETNIAQLVGRMVRAPLGRHIDANEHLNSVALYLPHYDAEKTQKIVDRLTGRPGEVPPTKVRNKDSVIVLNRAPGMEACFELLEQLPSYTVPPRRTMRPVPRLGRLASLLAHSGLSEEPVKTYRMRLVEVLIAERKQLEKNPEFKTTITEADILDVRRIRMAWGVQRSKEENKDNGSSSVKVQLAEENIDDLFSSAGRRIGEGIHIEYLRARLTERVDARRAKVELYVLASNPETLKNVEAEANEMRATWSDEYKAAVAKLDEAYRQSFREIQGGGSNSVVESIEAPFSIEWSKARKVWPKHLYADARGNFPEDFTDSTWEAKTVETELGNEAIVGWFRNPPRKRWSLTITRLEGTTWVPFFPDLIFFRKTRSGLIADLIDPHLLAAEDMPARAVRLAQYARTHAEHFGRIEMVIYEGAGDTVGKRIDLTNESLRREVAELTTTQQLKSLFARHL